PPSPAWSTHPQGVMPGRGGRAYGWWAPDPDAPGRRFEDPMTEGESPSVPAQAAGSQRLAILLAMAMFGLVVDTSLVNVSISSVVRDLDTTVSGVQSAIALEALVSAAFILIGSKVGD